MQLYASTTFLGKGRTDVSESLAVLSDLNLDGVELGSTHTWRPDLADVIRRMWTKPLLTHNYFPPAEDELVLNIASADPDIRTRSIQHMRQCLHFAADIGASLYTIHPGFLAEPVGTTADDSAKTYDFKFSGEQVPYERAFFLMTDALRELVEIAADVGVALAIESEGSLTSAGVTLMEKPTEYERLFELLPEGLGITLNLAHTALAAKGHGFEMAAFIKRFRARIRAVEFSHNDGYCDQHMPLEISAPVLDWLPHLPNVPLIMEFRGATGSDIQDSASILRAACAALQEKTLL